MSANPFRILVVDDDESMRSTLMAYISRMGVRVRVASDASEARLAIQSEPDPFDIVLTDLKLPDGSGFDIVKAAHVRSSSTLVTIITGFASLETAIEAIRLGAHDYVTKPFSLDQIGITVRNMIEHVTLARENARLSIRLQELLSEVNRLRSERTDLGRVLEQIRGEVAENGRKLDCLLEERKGGPAGGTASEPAPERPSSAPAFYFSPQVAPARPVPGYQDPSLPASRRRGSS